MTCIYPNLNSNLIDVFWFCLRIRIRLVWCDQSITYRMDPMRCWYTVHCFRFSCRNKLYLHHLQGHNVWWNKKNLCSLGSLNLTYFKREGNWKQETPLGLLHKPKRTDTLIIENEVSRLTDNTYKPLPLAEQLNSITHT